MALTPEQLKDYTPEQLISALVDYSVSLDQANEMISLANAVKDSQTENIKGLEAENIKLKEEIETINKKVLELENSLNESKKSKSKDKKDDGLKTEIDNLKQKIEYMEKLVSEKDNEISHLKNKQSVVKSNIPVNQGTIHTYNIMGYDNRTGTAVNGGDTYTKATVLIKFKDNILNWEVISPDLNMKLNKSLNLNEKQDLLDKLNVDIKKIGSYTAIKEFLEIPNIVEAKFNDDIFMIREG